MMASIDSRRAIACALIPSRADESWIDGRSAGNVLLESVCTEVPSQGEISWPGADSMLAAR